MNSPNLDFNDAESESATQTFVLTDDKVDENDVDDADSKKVLKKPNSFNNYKHLFQKIK